MSKRKLIMKWKSGRGYRYLLECNNCGNLFEVIGKLFNSDPCLYCSKKCSNSSKEKIDKINRIKSIKYQKNKEKFGYAFRKENRDKMSNGQQGKITWNTGKSGEKMPNWRGGISFEPYGIEFNKCLRDRIRERDNFICQKCGVLEANLDKKLSVHHIDYDKMNNNDCNLISLCPICHCKTNFRRGYWTSYFKR